MLTWTVLARLAIVATLPLMLMARLPSGEVMWGFLLTGLALLHCPYQPVRLAGITLLLLAWACNDARLIVRDIESSRRVLPPTPFRSVNCGKSGSKSGFVC